MLFLLGLVLGCLIAAARLAHQSGNLSAFWYRSFVGVLIAVGLVVAVVVFLERLEGA